MAMVDDIEELSLVRECRELEEGYKSNFISQILNVKEPADSLEIIRVAQRHIMKNLTKHCCWTKFQISLSDC